MAKVLVQFAHPALDKSRIHRSLIAQVRRISDITINDLYEAYPDFDIDIEREQRLLLQHDIIVLQHPFYWYSSPAMIKQWMDLVLEHNWAYGSKGKMLAGKCLFNAISCGGSREAYSPDGHNRFTIRQLLAPFDQTAHLCRMNYLPPFAMFGTLRSNEQSINNESILYHDLLQALATDRASAESLKHLDYMNDFGLVTYSTS